MSIPRSLEGFDVHSAVARMLDQPALWWQAVGMFVEHFAEWESEWQASQGDETSERKRVHAVRSAAANIGAERLASAAGSLETLLLARASGKLELLPSFLRDELRVSFQQAWGAAAEAWRAHPVSRAETQ